MLFPFQMKKAGPRRRETTVWWSFSRPVAVEGKAAVSTSRGRPPLLVSPPACSSQTSAISLGSGHPTSATAFPLTVSMSPRRLAHGVLALKLPHALATASCVQRRIRGSTQRGMLCKLGTDGSPSLPTITHTCYLSGRFISVA